MTRTHVYDPRRINDGTTHGRCRTVRTSMDHCGEDIRPFLLDCARHPRTVTRTARTYHAPDGRVRHVDDSVTWCSTEHAPGATDTYPLAVVPAYAFRLPDDAGFCPPCGVGRGHNRTV